MAVAAGLLRLKAANLFLFFIIMKMIQQEILIILL